jgi:hypothetical protein
LRVSGTKDILALAADPKNPAALNQASKRAGQTAVIQGVMAPAKNLKAPVPLQVREVK